MVYVDKMSIGKMLFDQKAPSPPAKDDIGWLLGLWEMIHKKTFLSIIITNF
jgi:hypothetical protein